MSKGRNNRPASTNFEATDITILSTDDPAADRMEAMFTRLTKNMTDSFSSCITQLVTSIEDKLNIKIDVQGSEIFSLTNKVGLLEKRVDELARSNATLTSQLQIVTRDNQQLHQSIDSLEQYTRADSILIHGLPLPQTGSDQNLYTEIPTILNSLIPTIHLTPEMISVTHRLPTQAQSASSPSSSRPPPVVVRFTRRLTRTTLMANRKLLKGKHIVLTDHLTPARSSLLKKATSLVTNQKIGGAWSHEGKILIKTLSNRTVVILSEEDLNQFA
jgi:archaellum component FlaC